MKPTNPLARVSATPRPPYYAVITTAELTARYDRDAHLRLGATLHASAHELGGFLGLEVFFEGDASIAVSYWSSAEAVERWRNHALHVRAKGLAKSAWFGPCITRVARVEDDYGFGLPVSSELGR